MKIKTTSTAPKCSNIISKYDADKGKNLGHFHGVYFHIPVFACYVCTQPECDTSKHRCESTLPSIPVYNNIFEFGISGKYFPTKVYAEILLSSNCYFKFEASLLLKDDAINVTISECNKKSKSCSKEPFQTLEYFRPNNWYCLYFAVAFFESNKMHYSISFRCDVFATAKFESSKFMQIKEKECGFEPEKLKAEVQLKFEQDESRIINGVPVILPCSPGGHGVEVLTGHFVVGDTCHIIFGRQGAEGTGIEFIIKHLYNNSEDWLFPKRDFEDIVPLYLWKSDKASERELMLTTKSKNTIKANGRRSYCDYIYPRAVTERALTTGFYKGKRYKECEDILSLSNLRKPNTLSSFLKPSSCLVCTVPVCDFSDSKCKQVSALETLYVYNNIFEFGIPLIYFPKKVFLRLNINPNCYFKLILEEAAKNYTINVEECLVSNGQCEIRKSVYHDLVKKFPFCANLVFLFHDDNKIHYGFSPKCDVIASTELEQSTYLVIDHKSCHFNKSADTISVEIEVLQDDDRTYNGIPIILPCSPGGYTVDTKSGRFIHGKACKKMAFRSDSPRKGIQFILEKLYGNNEDLLFPSEIHSDRSYPYPIYYRLNEEFYSPSQMKTRRVKNEQAQNRERIGCFTKQGSTTTSKSLAASAAGATTENSSSTKTGGSGGMMDSSEATTLKSQYGFIILLTTLIILRIFKLK
ncbi:UNVERIFIED_CONTAM: hypothetical protein RMT77_013670 [Armadillidium vulgare]